MSFLNAVKIKLGLNASATDNFVIESTGAGTGRIRKGDLATVGSDVLTWDASNRLGLPTPPINAANPCFSAYQSSAQTAFTSTTVIQFQAEEFDTTSAFNNTASTVGNTLPYSFNPLVAGYYQICSGWQSSAVTGNQLIAVYKNGAVYKYGNAPQVSATNPLIVVYAVVYLDGTGVGANSNVQIYGAQGTSGSTTASASTTYFQAALISRTA